jgi:hypothetical protein
MFWLGMITGAVVAGVAGYLWLAWYFGKGGWQG